ncbi:nucleotide-binding site LRR protein, putative [Medicago truncatula]|uniref:Nucleotide-binding site LRR protein, putative n=1 Tax=Medicago truncatula TaxID=3880 RepID=A0A072UTE6_MEDTR|nr:nucleotide-binding site LRR protein, putative [Medicago truncatula]
MASFLTDLAKPYVDNLINGAITESSYICCFTCIAKDFEEEIERSTVKQRVDLATRGEEDIQDVERYSSQHYIPFKSRESKYKELLDALKDDNNFVIGLKGMAGTGKPTLTKEIGIPQSRNHKGCRILITTRNMLVCNKLECSKTVQLELLSEEDAWTMFKSYACLSEISTKIFLDKGHKIANECKSLPVAIAAIASSLKGIQCPEEWDGALKSLQKHMPMHDVDVDDDMVKIYECLKFSYDNMKNEKAKRLFLLCSVFREDEEIPIERLIRLGIGASLFGENYGSYEDARS